jgi:hypothetical protein
LVAKTAEENKAEVANATQTLERITDFFIKSPFVFKIKLKNRFFVYQIIDLHTKVYKSLIYKGMPSVPRMIVLIKSMAYKIPA